jgi:nucleotide-binding universal stress UspA family protein
MFNHILLAADDLDHSRKAARLAGETARRMQSDLRIVVAYPAVPDYLGLPEAEQATAARVGKAESTARSLLEAVGTIPGKVETEVLEGTVAEAAMAASRAPGCDLVFMPTREPGFWSRMTSWFRNLEPADRAGCPVMLVQ